MINEVCSFDCFQHCLSRSLARHDKHFVADDAFIEKARIVYNGSWHDMVEFGFPNICILCHRDTKSYNKTAQD